MKLWRATIAYFVKGHNKKEKRFMPQVAISIIKIYKLNYFILAFLYISIVH